MELRSDLGIMSLCNAVVEQAVRDYKAALIAEALGLEIEDYHLTSKYLKNWFNSPDYLFYTNVPADAILSKIEDEVADMLAIGATA